MKVRDVFADEVMDFTLGTALPPVLQLFTIRVTPLFRAGDVANRCVEPDVPKVARRIRNLEAKVGPRSADVPIAKCFRQEMSFQIIGCLTLQRVAAIDPIGKELMEFVQLNETGGLLRGFPVWRR